MDLKSCRHFDDIPFAKATANKLAAPRSYGGIMVGKRIFFILSLLSLASMPLASDDVLDDSVVSGHQLESNTGLTDADLKKISALSRYGAALIDTDRAKAVDAAALDDLFAALAADPHSEEVLRLILVSKPSGGLVKRHRRGLVERLEPIASAHPDAVKLVLATAYLQSFLEERAGAEKLLRSCFAIRGGIEMDDADYSELVLSLLSAFAADERFDEGAETAEEALIERPDSLPVVLGAYSFFDHAAAKAAPGRFLWFFAGAKDTYKRRAEDVLERMREMAAARRFSVEELVPVLLRGENRGGDEFIGDILFEQLAHDPDNLSALMFLAAHYFDTRRYRLATRVWRRIFRDFHPKPDYYYDLGRAALLAGDYNEAAIALAWYIRLGGRDSVARYQLAAAHFRMNEYEQAIEALALLGLSPDVSWLRACCYRALEDYAAAARAMAETEAAVKISGSGGDLLNGGFYILWSLMAERAGDFEGALGMLRDLRVREPENAAAANALGYLLAQRGEDLAEAEACLTMALDKEPDNAAYLDSMAWILYRSARFEQAAAYIARAIVADGDAPDPVILDHAGDIYAALGAKEKAVEYWRRALAFFSLELDAGLIESKINRAEGE